MAEVSTAIYGNSLLQEDYERILGPAPKSNVIYTGSDINSNPKKFDPLNLKFAYLGNMGFMRPKALAQVGKVLQKISPAFFLDVYGEPQTEDNERLLSTSPGLRFHGVVDYSKVKEVISDSDFLFHVEYDSPQYAESLKYGFSTKIADSIKSQRIFVLFAPDYIACSRYIKKTCAGIYANTEGDLEQKLREVIQDGTPRQILLKNASEVAAKNHDSATNVAKMLQALSI